MVLLKDYVDGFVALSKILSQLAPTLSYAMVELDKRVKTMQAHMRHDRAKHYADVEGMIRHEQGMKLSRKPVSH